MDHRWLVATLAVATAFGYIVCLRGKEYLHLLPGDAPACVNLTVGEAWNVTEHLLLCGYLGEDDMDMLELALAEAAAHWDSFAVSVYYSNGSAMPDDLFAGLNLDFVELYDCHFGEVPYRLLSAIESPSFDGFAVESDNFTSAEVSAPGISLPFSESVKVVDFQFTNIQRIDPAAFTQYPNLEVLLLWYNSINSIELELLGLSSIKVIHLQWNNISSIETGAFRDLKNLESLDISSNRLVNLEEGAFDGLEESPITHIYLPGNPFNCTCELQWLKEWLFQRNLLISSSAECLFPKVGSFDEVIFCNQTEIEDYSDYNEEQ